MNLFFITVIGSGSIVIAAAIGLVRFNKVDKSYKPFIIICCLAFLAEIASVIAAYVHRNESIPHNIYMFVESILYMFLFRNWGEFSRRKWTFRATLALLAAIWLTDNFILNSIFSINPLFCIIYPFTLIFLSINQLSRIIVSNKGAILKNARFLICISLVIFYSYMAMLYVFYFLNLNFNNSFYTAVQLVMETVNFIINLILALAILWIPRKQSFILPFS